MSLGKHQELIKQYEGLKNRFKVFEKRALTLEIFILAVVFLIKLVRGWDLDFYIIATFAFGIAVAWNFYRFGTKRILDEKIVDIILKGSCIERSSAALSRDFFTEKLRKFSVIGEIVERSIFDILFIWFFSVSLTHLIKYINPELIIRLRPITPFTTAGICFLLGWAYYQPFKPLVATMRSIEEKGEIL